jgi:hypothetical protein
MDTDHPINDLLQRLDPSEGALLDWLVPQLDESHMREIAALDGWNEEAYFQALKPVYERQPPPSLSPGCRVRCWNWRDGPNPTRRYGMVIVMSALYHTAGEHAAI